MSDGLGRRGRGRWGRRGWGRGGWWGGGYYAPTIYVGNDCVSLCQVQHPGNVYAQLACQRNCVASPGYYLAGMGVGEEDHTMRNALIAGAAGLGVGFVIGRMAQKKR